MDDTAHEPRQLNRALMSAVVSGRVAAVLSLLECGRFECRCPSPSEKELPY